VSRDAPGIFTEANAQNIPLAAALHQDGSEITLASPALPNEIVSLYGTGLGPLIRWSATDSRLRTPLSTP